MFIGSNRISKVKGKSGSSRAITNNPTADTRQAHGSTRSLAGTRETRENDDMSFDATYRNGTLSSPLHPPQL